MMQAAHQDRRSLGWVSLPLHLGTVLLQLPAAAAVDAGACTVRRGLLVVAHDLLL